MKLHRDRSLPATGIIQIIWRQLVLCVAIAIAVHATEPQAFGLKTHVWIGQRILAEIQDSCRVEIDDAPIAVNAQACASIREHPGSFLAGLLGPDAYPDLITGQVTTHPGIDGDWQTNDWLIHLYESANPGAELAFAAGYLVHAASDTFAHSYVNAYAGDIFVLSDERRVELRHFLLEKYIDSLLPARAFDPNSLSPPSEWLRDKLIHNSDASRLAKKSGFSLHVGAMHDIHSNVSKLADDLDRMEEDAARLIVGVPIEIAKASAQIASGETALKGASEALGLADQALQAEQALFDAAEKGLLSATTQLQRNLDEIDLLGREARLARDAAETARRVSNQAISELGRLRGRLLELDKEIQGVAQYVTKEVCRDEVVETVCSVFCPICSSVCKDVTRRVCKLVDEVNSAWAQINGQILDVRRRIADEETRIAQAGVDLTTNIELERIKLQEQASKQLLTAALDAAKGIAQTAFDTRKAALNAQIDATRNARELVNQLVTELARLRQRLLDLDGVESALKDLIARVDLLSGLAKNWRNGMATAGREFVVASNDVAKGMLSGNANFASIYLEWWKCTGNAYTGIPVQFGQSICGVENGLARMEEEVNKIVSRLLPPPFDRVYAEYVKVRERVEKEIHNGVSDAALHFAKLVAPDATTGKFIELLARPQQASRSMMNDAFATAADSDKPILTFPRISDLVDADMKVAGGVLDAEKFAALRNALVLSKLALMDSGGIRKLAWVIGADADKIVAPAIGGRSSILFDMLRSIDGNQQWQPYGLPYASTAPAAHRPVDPMQRRYGYGPNQNRPGFQLFIDDDLRRSMFLRLFTGPLNPGLRPFLSSYSYMECDSHPFAVTFRSNGDPESQDTTCADGVSELPKRNGSEWFRRVLNWLGLNPKR